MRFNKIVIGCYVFAARFKRSLHVFVQLVEHFSVATLILVGVLAAKSNEREIADLFGNPDPYFA